MCKELRRRHFAGEKIQKLVQVFAIWLQTKCNVEAFVRCDCALKGLAGEWRLEAAGSYVMERVG